MAWIIGIGIAAAAPAVAGAASAMSGASGTVRTADALHATLFCFVNIQRGTAQNQHQNGSDNKVFHITYHSERTLP